MEILGRGNYTNHISSLLGKGEAIVLTGHRRVGKSCVLELLRRQLQDKGNVLFLDMEDPDNAGITDFEKLNIWIKQHFKAGEQNYILIDEIQEVSQFERTLRYWQKQPHTDVVVTGSNATMLSSDIATAFAGRYMRVHVYGLSYGEYLRFNNIAPGERTLTDYLFWGGLPFLTHIDKGDTRSRTDYLGSIYDTILVKDILTRRQVRGVDFLDNLIRFVADNSGKLFSAASISKYMKGKESPVSSNTISEYMETLCNSYIIDRVPRYDIKGKRLFERQEKYYFEDLGLRNYLCRDKRLMDVEKVLENAVYLALKRRGYDVYVGQLDGKEVDFVARRGGDTEYYQVSYRIAGQETYDREFGNLKRIKDNHPKYVVTMDPLSDLVNDEGIRVLTAVDFLQDT